MFPGMNPRKMQQMMKKMGIQQVEIPATAVIIETPDKDIIITEPQVSRLNMMGQETFQVTGNVHERLKEPEINISDIRTVMEQAGVTEDLARKALIAAGGDIAKAIMDLKG
jgi:nascent polypeptide-associated complex subunit alpha